jgi:hypothetical protein
MVRYYGIYSNKGHLPKEYFDQGSDLPIDWASIQKSITGDNPLFCKKCNMDKIYIHCIIQRKPVINELSLDKSAYYQPIIYKRKVA